jgi:hypothetical protein
MLAQADRLTSRNALYRYSGGEDWQIWRGPGAPGTVSILSNRLKVYQG